MSYRYKLKGRADDDFVAKHNTIWSADDGLLPDQMPASWVGHFVRDTIKTAACRSSIRKINTSKRISFQITSAGT
jgi:hypothetical protein